jgi:hypothetical protein
MPAGRLGAFFYACEFLRKCDQVLQGAVSSTMSLRGRPSNFRERRSIYFESAH